METYLLYITRSVGDLLKCIKIVESVGYTVKYQNDEVINNIIENGFPTGELYSVVLDINEKSYHTYHNYDYDSYKKVVDNFKSSHNFIIVDGLTDLYKNLGIGVDYNTKNKLIYESVDDKEKLTIFPINNEEDFLTIQNFALKNGYKWSGEEDYIEYFDTIKCILIRPKSKVLTYARGSFNNVLMFYENDKYYNLIKVDTINDLKQFLMTGNIINYNNPKKLVYESVDDKEGAIICKINNEEDFSKLVKIGLKNNYKWSYDISKINYDDIRSITSGIFITLYKHVMFASAPFDSICLAYGDEYDVIRVEDVNRLDYYLNGGKNINYNEPKKLVYESKILKYNKFKK